MSGFDPILNGIQARNKRRRARRSGVDAYVEVKDFSKAEAARAEVIELHLCPARKRLSFKAPPTTRLGKERLDIPRHGLERAQLTEHLFERDGPVHCAFPRPPYFALRHASGGCTRPCYPAGERRNMPLLTGGEADIDAVRPGPAVLPHHKLQRAHVLRREAASALLHPGPFQVAHVEWAPRKPPKLMQVAVVAVLRAGLAIANSTSLAPVRRRPISADIDKSYGRRKNGLNKRRGFT
jgi:hypothetical protein